MDYYNEIKEKLTNEEIYSAAKDYFKERHKVITHFETGKHYEENIIGKYSK